MRRTLSSLLLLFLIGGSLAAFARGEVKPGVERWAVKTRLWLDGAPVIAKLQMLLDLPVPLGVTKNDRRYQTARLPPFREQGRDGKIRTWREGRLIRVYGFLHLAAEEPDGDYHVQLSTSKTDQSSCFIVEVPATEPPFVNDATVKTTLEPTRAFIRHLYGGKVPQAGRLLSSPVCVIAEGALFLDTAHIGKEGEVEPRGKKGCRSPTAWELHPVKLQACP